MANENSDPSARTAPEETSEPVNDAVTDENSAVEETPKPESPESPSLSENDQESTIAELYPDSQDDVDGKTKW